MTQTLRLGTNAAGIPVVRSARPAGIAWSDADDLRLAAEGQVRLWWGSTPVGLFLNTTGFHEQVATRVRRHDFGGTGVPFLGCDDLAVFKAFHDRTKDWADLEAMVEAGTLDLARVAGELALHLGPTDPRLARLLALPRR